MWDLCCFSAPDPVGRAQLRDEDTLTEVPTCGCLRPHGVEVRLVLSPCSGNLQTTKVSLVVYKTHSTPSVQTGISVSLQTSPISSSSCYTWRTSQPPSELGHLRPAAGPRYATTACRSLVWCALATTTCRSLVCPARGPASPQSCLQMPALGLAIWIADSASAAFIIHLHIFKVVGLLWDRAAVAGQVESALNPSKRPLSWTSYPWKAYVWYTLKTEKNKSFNFKNGNFQCPV